ncbi:hypothetical protein VNO77_34457 [Canavalia gladiata]|uniref:Uncharacterized protein n=1 Tax=Canavalia gladiata TaxID=3824 RepID=A0AAN9PX89_CANGL
MIRNTVATTVLQSTIKQAMQTIFVGSTYVHIPCSISMLWLVRSIACGLLPCFVGYDPNSHEFIRRM